MANFTGIFLNEIKMPDFVRVIGIEHSILPSVSQNLTTMSGKAGAYDYGNEVGVREINIDISIVMEEENTLPALLEQLSDWMYYTEPKKLVLGDDVTKYYLAKFTGDSNIKESFLVGEGTITFSCSNPYKFGEERQSLLIPGAESVNIINTGNADTFPYMTFEFTEDVTAFSVVADDEFIDLGTPYVVDDSRTISTHGKYALRDQLTSVNGWTNSASVNSGTVVGTYEVYSNHAFVQAGADYGTGIGYHGAGMQKPLDFAVQDFDAVFYFKMVTSKEQLGRMHMSLLSTTGSELFLMQISDGSVGNSNINFSIKAFGTENTLITQKVFASNISSLAGYLRLKRVGNSYLIEVYEAFNGGHRVIFTYKYTDSKGLYKAKVGQVKLHTGAYKDYKASGMEQRDVVITNLDVASISNNTSIPLIFRAGDVLEIDNETGAILKNGIPFYQYLNPSSSFIRLEKGANGISISPAKSIKNGVIAYRERSL